MQVVCSVDPVGSISATDVDVLSSMLVDTTGRGSDDNATAGTSAVGVVRCELTAPISNASATLVHLVFDVVYVTDAGVSRNPRPPHHHDRFCGPFSGFD